MPYATFAAFRLLLYAPLAAATPFSMLRHAAATALIYFRHWPRSALRCDAIDAAMICRRHACHDYAFCLPLTYDYAMPLIAAAAADTHTPYIAA